MNKSDGFKQVKINKQGDHLSYHGNLVELIRVFVGLVGGHGHDGNAEVDPQHVDDAKTEERQTSHDVTTL